MSRQTNHQNHPQIYKPHLPFVDCFCAFTQAVPCVLVNLPPKNASWKEEVSSYAMEWLSSVLLESATTVEVISNATDSLPMTANITIDDTSLSLSKELANRLELWDWSVLHCFLIKNYSELWDWSVLHCFLIKNYSQL